ncbi:MAG TPA: substrate-binding domain-containing protein [Candidatus Kapabacteria bacterium]|nr:substrate-binding domain-containing protein [Candidatus Kapabacteria bacterium]
MKHLFFLIVLVPLLTGCGKQGNVPQTETATTGNFQLVADEVLKPVTDSLVAGFMLENPDAKITVKYTSATEAVRELLNHDARAILIDRSLTSEERTILQQDSVTLPAYKLAEDGIGVIVANHNPLDAIAKSDLAKIMSGTISNWSSLARPVFRGASAKPGKVTDKMEGPITVALPAYPSSVEYVLDSILLKGAQTKAARVLRFTTSDSIIQFVRHSPDAIGFIGSAWDNTLTESNDTSVRTLPVMPADSSSRGLIEPVLLNMAYVAEGLYPLVTTVDGYSFEVPNTIPRGFLAYAATAHGQIVFKNFNVLPITQPIKIMRAP